MKIPDVEIPINTVTFPWELVMKAERAAEKVQERMHRTAAALMAARVRFAVIGGNAVGLWVATKDEGAVRNTKDVDILLDRRDWDRAVEAMSAAGFDADEVSGVTVFLDRNDPMPSRGVHVLFAGEQIRAHDAVTAPPVKVGLVKNGVPAIDLAELMTLKLIAYRRIDQVHIADLIRVGVIDASFVSQVPAELRPRLEAILADPDG
ncbi:MAG TPA: hypothetical protein VNT79_15505 [Phycisphaerae bacterium]|nr:hypothetical protein [Phycisphaerae bacterium]